jgi:hypothetical protein
MNVARDAPTRRATSDRFEQAGNAAYTSAAFGVVPIQSPVLVEEIMRKLMAVIVGVGFVVAVSAAAPKAAEQTWTGKISDSNCKDKHQAGEHDGKKTTDAECTEMCVKKGAKYVFMASDGKMYQIANQHSKTIASHAGQEVQLTGELKGDTITATKIVAPAKSK